MARIGINPARGKISGYRPARVTVTCITYIPDLTGYFEQRLEVLRLSLASLRAHTTPPYDLMIFDNGSCQPVVDMLREQERQSQIDYLLLSRQNIGKIGALQILFNAAPGEIIAYHDDDIFFYPGWLEAHLKILENFPRAGMVSGLPVRNAARHARQSLDQFALQGAPGLSISNERRIPDEWETDWALSTGRDPQSHLQETLGQQDMILRIGELEAIGSANHFQFVAHKSTLLQALPEEWSGKLMGHMVELDEAVDKLGYLRLSTVQRFTRHMGNTLSTAILQEAQRLGLLTAGLQEPAKKQATAAKKHWLLRIPGARWILMAVYKRLFDVLYK
jgi:glycosyltransferase involved in cell wall biosynthesis